MTLLGSHEGVMTMRNDMYLWIKRFSIHSVVIHNIMLVYQHISLNLILKWYI